MAADSEDFVILACTILIQSQSVMDRQTNTDRGVAHEKSCAVLNFARFDSREKSHLLSLIPLLARYRSLSLSLTSLYMYIYIIYISRLTKKYIYTCIDL